MSEPTANNHAESQSRIIATLRDADLLRTQTLSRGVENVDGQTPLMLAVLRDDLLDVEMHLYAGADIEAADNNGQSALQMAFSSRATDSEILKKFLRTMKNRYRDTNELAEKLFEAGCTLYHASFSRDVQVTEGLLRRGVRDVDWAGCDDRTGLHVAAVSNHLPLLTRLADAGANVNALDAYVYGALCMHYKRKFLNSLHT